MKTENRAEEKNKTSLLCSLSSYNIFLFLLKSFPNLPLNLTFDEDLLQISSFKVIISYSVSLSVRAVQKSGIRVTLDETH